ncbi:MAG: crossover junction endodeoxyribonuclease RuvC [Arachidicoccus sp.]|nr:crossover junction endodeoxyribonuclease RuvC [Arachidicoccus sp.]
MQNSDSVILAIDPGTIKMGYATIACSQNKLSLISMGTLLLSSHKDVYVRLQKIHATVCELIQLHNPNTFAIEAPFFGKNVQSMLKLGRAQGVAIAAAMQHHVPVTEYSPKKVKQSVTGNGNAAKEQVWKMLQQLFLIQETPAYLDASDALAVAVCHHYQNNSPLAGLSGKGKSWNEFIVKNPQRLIVK